MKAQGYKQVLMREEIHEQVRRVAFERRVSMRAIVEQALCQFFDREKGGTVVEKQKKAGSRRH